MIFQDLVAHRLDRRSGLEIASAPGADSTAALSRASAPSSVKVRGRAGRLRPRNDDTGVATADGPAVRARSSRSTQLEGSPPEESSDPDPSLHSLTAAKRPREAGPGETPAESVTPKPRRPRVEAGAIIPSRAAVSRWGDGRAHIPPAGGRAGRSRREPNGSILVGAEGLAAVAGADRPPRRPNP
jgi:hypothetical protein